MKTRGEMGHEVGTAKSRLEMRAERQGPDREEYRTKEGAQASPSAQAVAGASSPLAPGEKAESQLRLPWQMRWREPTGLPTDCLPARRSGKQVIS